MASCHFNLSQLRDTNYNSTVNLHAQHNILYIICITIDNNYSCIHNSINTTVIIILIYYEKKRKRKIISSFLAKIVLRECHISFLIPPHSTFSLLYDTSEKGTRGKTLILVLIKGHLQTEFFITMVTSM